MRMSNKLQTFFLIILICIFKSALGQSQNNLENTSKYFKQNSKFCYNISEIETLKIQLKVNSLTPKPENMIINDLVPKLHSKNYKNNFKLPKEDVGNMYEINSDVKKVLEFYQNIGMFPKELPDSM